jgi:hydroxymethylpyrimidine pyrophosphatase-like HAD family hydrolase/adenine/guanine phosphoribosyltransferase-like PRPP-binding protein
MIALSAARETNTQHEPRALVLGNLLNDLPVIATLLAREVKRRGWLDAYLLAAGLSQIVEDHLHPALQRVDLVARHLDVQTGRGARLGAKAARTTTCAMSTLAASPGSRVALRRWRVQLGALLEGLADRVVDAPPAASAPEAVAGAASTLVRTAGRLPRSLLRTPVRLPACFRSFDQHPDDLARLVDAFSRRWPARGRALLVVGVRTSGSYLAPLIAAELRARGYDAVRVLTVRPGRALARRERELVRESARRGGLALLTDDPPATGASLASVARTLRGLGVAEQDIVLVLQVSGEELPAALDSYPAVILPWDQWAVRERLSPEHVRATLGALLACECRVLAAERIPVAFDRRGHRRARFRVNVCDVRTGEHCERQVLVEGVGLGYLGAHVLAAAPDLAAFSPRVFGLRDGLLYREWLPDERRPVRVAAEGDPAVALSIAAYVAARRRALRVEEDASLRLGGEQPAWEVASMTLSRVFGRASLAARPLLTDRAARRLLRVEHPSVVDGDTDLDHWFTNDGGTLPMTKVGVGEHSFWHLGLACFDAAFDLAGATARASDAAFVRRLRQAYLDETGERVDEERWLLYELAHLWGCGRTHPLEAPALQRAAARALQRYFSEAFLRDLPPVSRGGPLCAVDVDGVLETEHLGFPSLTPSAARALRALLAHGYRPLLATGRSAEEIVGRCRAYGLAGAVGEYGAVTYDSADDRLQVLLSADEVRTLDRLRAALARIDGVDVDPGYRYSVRAFRHDATGRRVRLDAASRARARSAVTPAEIDAIDGDCQTDFVVRGVDKGVGLRALAEALGAGHAVRPLAFAVGDTAADRPAFDLAKVAFAPAHARALESTRGVMFTRRPYQAGFEEAVSRMVGHRPGACVRCRGPRLTGERELLLSVLGARERGLLAMGVHAMRLWARLW